MEYGYTASNLKAQDWSLANLLQVMNKMTRVLEPPIGAFVCSRATWDELKREFPSEVADLRKPLFGIEVVIEDTELAAKARALLMHADGKKVRLIENRRELPAHERT